MDHNEMKYEKSACPLTMNRRKFLAASGVMAMAVETGVLDFASSLTAGTIRTSGKPRIRTIFVRPDTERYWLGWPGAAYDIADHQKQYTKVITDAAEKLGIDLEIQSSPICDDATVSAFLGSLSQSPPDGILIIAMSLNEPA